MNYQQVKLLEGPELIVDFDAKRTRCKKCGKFIRFAMTPVGGYVPIIDYENGKWMSHFTDCRVPVQRDLFEERTRDMEHNQNLFLLSNL